MSSKRTGQDGDPNLDELNFRDMYALSYKMLIMTVSLGFY